MGREKIGRFYAKEVIRAIRNLRAEKNVKPHQRIAAILVSESAHTLLQEQAETIAALSRLDMQRTEIHQKLAVKPENSIALVVGHIEIYLPLATLINADEERSRLEADLAEVKKQIQRLEDLLASPFAEKAPPEVVEKEQHKLEDYRLTHEKIRKQLVELGSEA